MLKGLLPYRSIRATAAVFASGFLAGVPVDLKSRPGLQLSLAMIEKTGIPKFHEDRGVTIYPTAGGKRRLTYLSVGISLAVILILPNPAAAVPIDPPILISEATSTRAIAVESVTFTPQPFALTSLFGPVSDRRTRIILFAMNLRLQPGENLSLVTATAEDAAQRVYDLKVEYVGPVPQQEWLSAVVLRLNDSLEDVGDVLVRVSYSGAGSNRVRVGIGHSGGGPPDDQGATPTPVKPFTLGGQLRDDHDQGLDGHHVTLADRTDGTTRTLTTSGGGKFSFSNIAPGHNFIVTPATSAIFNFNALAIDMLMSDSSLNFQGTRRLYTVGGRVQIGPNAAGFLEIPISGAQATSVTTDANGRYSISLPAGRNYTITPSLLYYDFAPVSQVVNDLTSDQINLSFIGTRQTHTIRGKLSDQDSNGLAGTTVSLTGGQQRNTVTDGSGNYQFTAVPAGFDYTVTPQTNAYYSFVSSKIFTDLRMSQTANFAGTLRYYTVSGSVQLGPNSAPGLVLPITGSQATTVTTDENGNYSISFPVGGSYTITPALRYYDFSPVSQFVTDLTSDQINRSFVGTRQAFTISGRLMDQEGNGLAALTINLTGARQETTLTNATGHYQFTNLFAGYDYTITPPSTAAYTFAAQSLSDLISNQTLNFTGLRRLTLNGRVRNQSGNGIIGITMSLSGSENATTVTAGDGSYSLTATATGNYSVTPSIAQAWYTFAPASGQFNNLAVPQTTDFTATLAPVPNPSYVLEFDGQPKSVDYGNFWPEGMNLGHFFWEFWAAPGPNAGATYMLSDGYGGAHALLFGVGSFNSSEPNRYELLGNLFDGVKFDNYFGSDQGPAVGEWAHFAVGWDGQNIITYYNGVPVGKTPFAGPRRTPGPGGGGGRLLIGGSDHSNFDGRIAQVRGYEDSNPREGLPGGVESSFAPQTVFGLEGNLLSYYFRSGGVSVADLSRGYHGVSHGGWVRGTLAGILGDCGSCPTPQYVIDPTAPNFAANTAPSPVGVPPPAAVPGGALVFDSFSRANSTYLFGSHGGLGATEGGSAGIQSWQTNQSPSSPQPFGILNSIAVLLANNATLTWIQTGSATGKVDVRVDRRRGRWGRGIQTGLSFRVVDAANFFFAYTADTSGTPNSRYSKWVITSTVSALILQLARLCRPPGPR